MSADPVGQTPLADSVLIADRQALENWINENPHHVEYRSRATSRGCFLAGYRTAHKSMTAKLESAERELAALRDCNWRKVSETPPPIAGYREKPYVLAVDEKGRMSIGYARPHSAVGFLFVFAKPIGKPTHWMPLPNLPSAPGAAVGEKGGTK